MEYRKRKTRCQQCNVIVPGTRGRKFCTVACRMKAYRLRLKD